MKKTAGLWGTCLLLLATTTISAQSLKGAFGFGFQGGQQQLSGDAASVSLDYGGEGILSYRLSDRVSLNLAVGYSLLSYKLAGNPTSFQTNLITGNLYLDTELFALGPLRPFIQIGGGGLNFEAAKGKRFNDVEALGGGGLRLFLSRRLALSVGAFGKYTTGDDLDQTRSGSKDIYWGVRGGLTLYSGGQRQKTVPEPLISESTPLDSLAGETAESVQQSEAPSPEMEQQLAELQQNIEQLQKTLAARQQEIDALQQALQKRNQEIERMQAQQMAAQQQSPTINTADFDIGYNQARELFQNRRYREAAQAFQALINQFPNHKLVSNCYYWIGECYFAVGDLEAARQAFSHVLSYSNSFKLDDALLMLGRIYLRQGNTDSAREMFNRLLQQFPDSEYAPRARRYLSRMQ